VDGPGELVRAAIALADAERVGAVTLRAVAHRVGVTPAEVRRAFGSRDRLVAALVQHLFARPRTDRRGTDRRGTDRRGTDRRGTDRRGTDRRDVREPSSETPVQTLARLATQEWAAYREHPWLVTVVASSRLPLVPAVLDAARESTEAFAALGLDPPSALGRYVALSGYVQGMALLLLAEHGEVARSGTAYRAWWSDEVRRLDHTGAHRRHPWLDAASGGRLPESFAADADTWFRDGLDRVLAGLIMQDGLTRP
jgi:AcrR family transcriptional regulator